MTKNRTEPESEVKIVEKEPEKTNLLTALTPAPVSAPVPASNPAPVSVTPGTKKFDSIVSADYDWSSVSACLSSKNYGCVCYGQSGQRLMVPAGMCESAITYGWPQSSKKIRSIHHVKIIKTKVKLPPAEPEAYSWSPSKGLFVSR